MVLKKAGRGLTIGGHQAGINEDIEKTNASVVETNMSIVAANRKADSRFFEAYQDAIGAYCLEPNRGRSAFETIAHSFIDS